MNFMLGNGLTVYLRMTPAQLKNRLASSPGERPLLKDIGNRGLQEFIAGKLAEREKWYSMAEIIADGFNTDITVLYTLIKNRIRE
jgi:shikimate kinase